MPRSRTLWSLVLLALVATGCRFGVRAEVVVDRDGSGTAALVLALDAALLEELDALAVDPTAELTAAASAAADWELEREVTEDAALVLTLRHEAVSPDALTDAFRELAAGLSDDDPALLVDLDLVVDDDGAATLDGSVQLRPPVGPGVVTDAAGAAELAELVATSTDAALQVTLPGPVTDADADVTDGSTLTWEVAPGEPRTVTASSAAPTGFAPELIAAAIAGVLLVLSAVAIALVVRRRRRSA